MGCYASSTCSISVSACFRLARKFHLPEPVRSDDGDYFTLTAKDIKKWSEAIDFELSMGVDRDIIDLGLAVNIFQENAQEYISGCALKANKLDIRQADRKDWFRKKTREYRMVFA